MKRQSSDGKLLERLVHCIQAALADRQPTTVRQNVTLTDLDGEPVQIDVLVETIVNEIVAMRIVFECKDHARPIEKKLIQAFHASCERLPADKKVFVSSHGFQKGARIKAREHNITLLELRPVTEDDANTDRIRELFALLSVHKQVMRAGVFCPSAPDTLPRSAMNNLYRSDRVRTIAVLDLAQELVKNEPPPTEDILHGCYSDMRKRFEFDPGEYFIAHDGQFYDVGGIFVDVRVIKGVPVSTPQRLVGSSDNAPYADIMAFKLPLLGGIGTVGTVVSSTTGDLVHFFQVPAQVDLSGEYHLYVKYKSRETEAIQENSISCIAVPDASGGARLEFDLNAIAEATVIIDARLVKGRARSIEWSVTSLEVECEGHDAMRDVDERNWYFGSEHVPYDFRELLRESLMANPPPHEHLPLGVVSTVRILVECLDRPFFVRTGNSFCRVLAVRATIDFRRLPTPHDGPDQAG